MLCRKSNILFCICFAIFESIGILIYKHGKLHVNSGLFFEFVVICFSSMILCYIVLKVVEKITHILVDRGKNINVLKSSNYYFYTWVFIAIAWLIWLISFFPGSMSFDMADQLIQYYDGKNFQGHPPFITLIMGICMDVGKKIGSDNIGFFIYILIQFLIISYGCAKACIVIKKIFKNDILFIISVLFYSFFPLFGGIIQFGVKDSLNYGLELLAFLKIIEMWYSIKTQKKVDAIDYFCFLMFTFFSSLCRKEMIYLYIIIIIAQTLFVISQVKNWKLAINILLGVFIIYFSNTVSNKLITDVLFNKPFIDRETEALSIPLQQIARFVTYDGNLILDKEKKVIGECFNVGYNSIPFIYNPNLSDPIKVNFKSDIAQSNGFWNVYLKLLKRKPSVFLESILASSYGYFSVVPTCNQFAKLPQLHMDLRPLEIKKSNCFIVKYPNWSENLRFFLSNFVYSLQKPYNLLYSFGFYTWFIIFLLLRSIKNEGMKSVIIFIMPLLLILVCIASPVNDYGRYYMGVIYLIPLLYGHFVEISKYSK